MGGTVFVGIRRRDETEHLYECWTNSMPRWFADPEFLYDGPGVAEFIRLAEERLAAGGSIYTARHDGVTFSEYGVILIDHVAKKILSCQGYTRVGRMRASWRRGEAVNIPPDDTKIITKLHRAGRLEKLEGMRSFKPLTEQTTRMLLELFAASEDGSLPNKRDVGVVVHSDLSDFDVSHTGHCAPPERAAVRDFLVDNGWKARVYDDEPEWENDE